MINWLYNLPVAWMTLVVFGATYLFAGAIYWVVTVLAVGERARVQKQLAWNVAPTGHHFRPACGVCRRSGLG